MVVRLQSHRAAYDSRESRTALQSVSCQPIPLTCLFFPYFLHILVLLPLSLLYLTGNSSIEVCENKKRATPYELPILCRHMTDTWPVTAVHGSQVSHSCVWLTCREFCYYIRHFILLLVFILCFTARPVARSWRWKEPGRLALPVMIPRRKKYDVWTEPEMTSFLS